MPKIKIFRVKKVPAIKEYGLPQGDVVNCLAVVHRMHGPKISDCGTHIYLDGVEMRPLFKIIITEEIGNANVQIITLNDRGEKVIIERTVRHIFYSYDYAEDELKP